MASFRKFPPSQTLRQQAAALPWRADTQLQIMLITSLDTRRWVLPKGGLIAGETLASAAAREAHEEAGLEGEIGREVLGSYRYEKRGSDGSMRAYSVSVYPLKVVQQHDDWPERGLRTTRWFSVEDAAAAVNEGELRELILASRSFG